MTSNMRLGVLWILAGLAAAAAIATALPAMAAPPGTDMIVPTSVSSAQGLVCYDSTTVAQEEGCQTDNSTVSYYMDSSGAYELESEDKTIVKAVAARYNNTDLTVSYDSSPTFSGSGQTDLVFQEGSTDLPDGFVGITWCHDKTSGSTWKCDQQYTRIRGGGQITEKTAGHEWGHAMGLLHGIQVSPISKDECASKLGIMRSPLRCVSSTSLGTLVIDNLNYVY